MIAALLAFGSATAVGGRAAARARAGRAGGRGGAPRRTASPTRSSWTASRTACAWEDLTARGKPVVLTLIYFDRPHALQPGRRA